MLTKGTKLQSFPNLIVAFRLVQLRNYSLITNFLGVVVLVKLHSCTGLLRALFRILVRQPLFALVNLIPSLNDNR